jgi:beta-glucosidase
VTMSDPVLCTYRAYVAGVAPPGVKSWRRALRVCRNLVKGHVRAYHAMHNEAEKTGSEVQVGLAKHFRIFDPLRNTSTLDRLTAITFHYFFNDLVPNSLREGILGFPLGLNRYVPDMEGCFDFLGLNYYTRDLVGWRPKYVKQSLRALSERIPETPSGRDADIYPEALYRLLEHAARLGTPLYVSENGIATDDDTVRCMFIACHLAHLHDAVEMGGDIRGYFYYSLTDGPDPHGHDCDRTGLVRLDGSDLQARIKPSGRLYGGISRENGLSPKLLREYCPNLSD